MPTNTELDVFWKLAVNFLAQHRTFNSCGLMPEKYLGGSKHEEWETPETAEPPQEQLEQGVAPEGKKEKGIMLKIGEKVREYAPSVISGAAAGALLGEVGRLNALIDARTAEFLFGETGRKMQELISAPFGMEHAVWLAVGAGLGAIGSGLLKKWKEEPEGFR